MASEQSTTDPTTRPPGHDVAAYLRDFPTAMALGAEDPAAIVDRYHTSDLEQYSDGLRLDRDALVAHARPARRNVEGLAIDVHDAVSGAGRVAARYTLTATMRSGDIVANEVYMFGLVAADGRLRRIDQLTRSLTPSG